MFIKISGHSTKIIQGKKVMYYEMFTSANEINLRIEWDSSAFTNFFLHFLKFPVINRFSLSSLLIYINITVHIKFIFLLSAFNLLFKKIYLLYPNV